MGSADAVADGPVKRMGRSLSAERLKKLLITCLLSERSHQTGSSSLSLCVSRFQCNKGTGLNNIRETFFLQTDQHQRGFIFYLTLSESWAEAEQRENKQTPGTDGRMDFLWVKWERNRGSTERGQRGGENQRKGRKQSPEVIFSDLMFFFGPKKEGHVLWEDRGEEV